MTEKEKMLAGLLYNAMDPILIRERKKARLLFQEYNLLKDDQKTRKLDILKELLPFSGEKCIIESPFYCDYGYNIHLGENVFFNYNCILLDVCEISIGSNTMFGPGVQLLTATHPVKSRERLTGLESGKPISIGEDCWIGGGVIVLPGVTIGDRSVIGAGGVVTRDIPDDTLAVGNPCRVIKHINDEGV